MHLENTPNDPGPENGQSDSTHFQLQVNELPHSCQPAGIARMLEAPAQ
jgi:hypothetical protein